MCHQCKEKKWFKIASKYCLNYNTIVRLLAYKIDVVANTHNLSLTEAVDPALIHWQKVKTEVAGVWHRL